MQYLWWFLSLLIVRALKGVEIGKTGDGFITHNCTLLEHML